MARVKQNVQTVKHSRKMWRERIGVEPTADTAGHLPTDLKSAEPTGTHPLPNVFPNSIYQGSAWASGRATRFFDGWLIQTRRMPTR